MDVHRSTIASNCGTATHVVVGNGNTLIVEGRNFNDHAWYDPRRCHVLPNSRRVSMLVSDQKRSGIGASLRNRARSASFGMQFNTRGSVTAGTLW